MPALAAPSQQSAILGADCTDHGWPPSDPRFGPPNATRHRLPDERRSITHKFKIENHEGYFTVGLYPNGEPGELFITMAKEGSTISGLIGSFAQAISLGLQHGVPIRLFCEKYILTRFEPSGWTGNKEIEYAHSIMDYIFRWVRERFVPGPHLRPEPPIFGDAEDCGLTARC
jgi:ribonucleoside-diphosphate reductase alpha chain